MLRNDITLTKIMSINYEKLLFSHAVFVKKSPQKKYARLIYEDDNKEYVSKGIVLKRRNNISHEIFMELKIFLLLSTINENDVDKILSLIKDFTKI